MPLLYTLDQDMLQIATVLLHLIGIALWQYTSLPWIHHSEQHVDETSLNFRKQMMPEYNIVFELSEMLLPYNQVTINQVTFLVF